MKAGRELDALVAEKVMGIEPWPGRPGAFRAPIVSFGVEPKPCLPPEYSIDIRCAWKVANKLSAEWFDPTSYGGFLLMSYNGRWEVHSSIYQNGDSLVASAETAPLAICLAALKAKGIPLPE